MSPAIVTAATRTAPANPSGARPYSIPGTPEALPRPRDLFPGAGKMVAPSTLAKLKAGQDHIPVDSPEALPFLLAMDDFLKRWFGIGLDQAEDFYNVALSRNWRDSGNGDVESMVTAPSAEKPGFVSWEWDASFEGFGVSGIFSVSVPLAVADDCPLSRRWEAEVANHGDKVDLSFTIKRDEQGNVTEKVSVFPGGM